MTRTALLIPVAALIAFTGCAAKSTPVPQKPTETKPVDLARAKLNDLPTGIAVNAAAAGAKAGPKDETTVETKNVSVVIANGVVVTKTTAPVPPTPPTPPTPPSPPAEPVKVIRAASTPAKTPTIKLVKIRSDKPHESEERAVEDALEVAQIELMKRFAQLDPPVNARPSVVKIRREFLRKDSVASVKPTAEEVSLFTKAGVPDAEKRVWAELDVEVSEAQVQELRSTERVTTGVRISGVVFAVLLAAYGFLRLESYTRGYLTVWLAVGGAVLVAAAVFLARSTTGG